MVVRNCVIKLHIKSKYRNCLQQIKTTKELQLVRQVAIVGEITPNVMIACEQKLKLSFTSSGCKGQISPWSIRKTPVLCR